MFDSACVQEFLGPSVCTYYDYNDGQQADRQTDKDRYQEQQQY